MIKKSKVKKIAIPDYSDISERIKLAEDKIVIIRCYQRNCNGRITVLDFFNSESELPVYRGFFSKDDYWFYKLSEDKFLKRDYFLYDHMYEFDSQKSRDIFYRRFGNCNNVRKSIWSYNNLIRDRQIFQRKKLRVKKAEEVMKKVNQPLPGGYKKFLNDVALDAGHYIAVFKEGKTRTAYCSHCGTIFTLVKAVRENKLCVCTSCGGKYPVFYGKKRKRHHFHSWTVIPQVTADRNVVFRYQLSSIYFYGGDCTNPVKTYEEPARMIFTPNGSNCDYYEKHLFGRRQRWIDATTLYFNYYRFMNVNQYYNEHTFLFTENLESVLSSLYHSCEYLNLSDFKQLEEVYEDHSALFYYLSDHGGAVLEKFVKLNFDKLLLSIIYGDPSHFFPERSITLDYSKSKIHDVMCISKNAYARFLKNPVAHHLLFLQKCEKNPKFSYSDAEYNEVTNIFEYSNAYDILKLINENNLSVYKTCGYIKKCINKFGAEPDLLGPDYIHYIKNLRELGYAFTKRNLFPKNFYAADKKAADELHIKRKEDNIRKIKDIPQLAKRILEALSKDQKIREFFSGSRGLQILIPESSDELLKMGDHLHNCLSSFDLLVAKGKTSVFFIKRLDSYETDNMYYAMEYKEGELKQLEGRFHSKAPDDVIEFVKDFSEALSKIEFNPADYIAA